MPDDQLQPVTVRVDGAPEAVFALHRLMAAAGIQVSPPTLRAKRDTTVTVYGDFAAVAIVLDTDRHSAHQNPAPARPRR